MFALDGVSASAEAVLLPAAPASAVLPQARRAVMRAGQLGQPTEAIDPHTTNEQVHQRFTSQPLLETLAVVQAQRPLGLIARQRFMEHYARPFARDVFGKRSCMVFTDKTAQVVEADLPIEQLVQQALASGSRVLKEGFITTEQGCYAGIGTGHALVAAMSELEADKTRQLMASIDYASLIQRSHLIESDRVLARCLPEHGLLWEPRDVVGGDAYFFRHTPQGLLGCVFDCTGHGVPGAFMTLIALSFLEQAVSAGSELDPGALLGQMNRYIKRVLQQRSGATPPWQGTDCADKASSDGLDGAIFMQSDCGQHLRYASARLDLLVASPVSGDGVAAPHAHTAQAAAALAPGIALHGGSKLGIGYASTAEDAQWPTQALEITPGSLLMIATDGVIDQVGGPRQIAHGRKRLARFLDAQREHSAAQVCAQFQQAFVQWQGAQRRRDDVSLLVWRNLPMRTETSAHEAAPS